MKEVAKRFPDYEKPPVIEVVCGIVFEKIEQFKGAHLGLFWQKVRKGFPKCEHAPPLGFSPESTDLMKNLPLPRMWFVSEEDDRLIQLQNDRMLYNWRKVEGKELYPRYDTIIEPFKNNLEVLRQFLEEEDLGKIVPVNCELTYINHIPQGSGWNTLSDIHEVLPDLNWRSENERFLPQPLRVGWNVAFRLEDEDRGHLNVSLEYGTRRLDKRPVLVLQLTARGLGGKKTMEAVWDWFDVGHKWIVCGFSDLTGSKVQAEVWKRTSHKRGHC
jgi:uncharacterized protein (TIGR04255 family)